MLKFREKDAQIPRKKMLKFHEKDAQIPRNQNAKLGSQASLDKG